MSEWKTLRVRTARLDAIKARAEAEGTNATAWADRALGAALAGESPDGVSSGGEGRGLRAPEGGALGGDQGAVDGRTEPASRGVRERAVLTTPDPRRAPEPLGVLGERARQPMGRMARRALELQERAEREARE